MALGENVVAGVERRFVDVGVVVGLGAGQSMARGRLLCRSLAFAF